MKKKRALTNRMEDNTLLNGPAVMITECESTHIDEMSRWLGARSALHEHLILDMIPTQRRADYRAAWHIHDDSIRLLFSIVFSDYIRRGPAVNRSRSAATPGGET